MPKKGITNNPAGRPKGTPNRITGQLKQVITEFLETNWQQFETDWLALEPEKRLQLYERLLRYIVPPAQDELASLTPAQLDELIAELKTQHNEKQIRKVS
jgi:hypothetical protein